MNITWSIIDCEYRANDGFILLAHWKAVASENGLTAVSQSTCNFSGGKLSKPYDNVTEQDVLNWCWSNGLSKQAVENALSERVEAQKSPKVLNGAPWKNTLGE